MKDLEHIDEFFSDKLNQHEENVPPYIWDQIADQLDHKQKQKRLVYFRAVAASAALLVAFLAGYFLTSNPLNNQIASHENTEKQQTISTKQDIPEGSGSANSTSTFSESQSTTAQKTEQKQNDIVQPENLSPDKHETKQLVAKRKNDKGLLAKSEQEETYHSVENEPTFLQKLFNIDFTAFETKQLAAQIVYPDNIQIAYADPYGVEEIELDEKSVNKWLVGGSVSPLYSYSNSAATDNFNETSNRVYGTNYPSSNEQGVLSYAGGVNVGYQINKRLNVYSGVYYSEVGQVSSDVYINEYQSSATEPLEINTSMGNIRTGYSSYNLVNSVEEDFSAPADYTGNVEYLSNTINSKIYQYIEFVEIPVLLKYKLIDRRFGMQLLGGVSTGFVVGNESLLEYEQSKYDLGETENIQTVNYNSTLGLGFVYALNDHLSMNLEPTFKYALNSLNTSYNVYPYSFAVFTGLNYKF